MFSLKHKHIQERNIHVHRFRPRKPRESARKQEKAGERQRDIFTYTQFPPCIPRGTAQEIDGGLSTQKRILSRFENTNTTPHGMSCTNEVCCECERSLPFCLESYIFNSPRRRLFSLEKQGVRFWHFFKVRCGSCMHPNPTTKRHSIRSFLLDFESCLLCTHFRHM